MQDVAPFHTADNKTYQPEYVAGFIAERYSIGLKEAWERAKQVIRHKLEANIEDEVRSKYRADHVRISQVHTVYSAVTYKYLLLPVWLSTYKYKGKVYHFMVNGQSGKAGGQIPVSPLRVAIAVVLVAAIFLLCSDYAIYGFLLAVIAVIMSVICYFQKM